METANLRRGNYNIAQERTTSHGIAHLTILPFDVLVCEMCPNATRRLRAA